MSNHREADILANLAKVNKNSDEFDHLTNIDELGDDLSKAVSELRNEERAAAVKEAAQLVLFQINTGKSLIDHHRTQLANARKMEKQSIASIEYAAVAMAYGRETQNYLPLLAYNKSNGMLCQISDEQRVPSEDFKRLLEVVRAKQKEVQAAAKTKTKNQSSTANKIAIPKKA